MKPLSLTVIMYSKRIYKVYVMYVLALSDKLQSTHTIRYRDELVDKPWRILSSRNTPPIHIN